MDLYKFHAKSAILKGYEEANDIVPARIIPKLGKEKLTAKQIQTLTKHAKLAYKYALVTKKPFPEGEKVLAKDPEYVYWYAINVLGKRFPAGEDVISKDNDYAFYYAQDVIKGPWPKGEDAISKDAGSSYSYVYEIIKGPWPKGEDAIAKDPEFAVPYAKFYLKKRFLKAEPIIAKSKYRHEYELHFGIEL